MEAHIEIQLFATLAKYQPENADRYPIRPGISVAELADQLAVPREAQRSVIIDGVRHEETATLQGGERVAIFPPIAGG